MIDNLAILISCGCVLLVAVRAVLLDARLPWFKPTAPADTRAPAPRRHAMTARTRR
jgi:hypothetical protein